MVKSLILCEGGDDAHFLRLLTNSLEINKRQINIKPLGSKSPFFKVETYREKNIIQMLDNGDYEKVLFIFDSDFIEDDNIYGGFENGKKEIMKIIEELEIKDISDFYIMCDPISKNGNLEHLILSTLNNQAKSCIENLLFCIKPFKTDGNKKILISGYKTIFKEPVYNFEHKNYNLLKEKIENLK